jgi:hypothetical protein
MGRKHLKSGKETHEVTLEDEQLFDTERKTSESIMKPAMAKSSHFL